MTCQHSDKYNNDTNYTTYNGIIYQTKQSRNVKGEGQDNVRTFV